MLLLSALAGDSIQAQSGRIRQLVCRGKSGIELRVDKNPSPRSDKLVTMVLRYQPNKKALASNYRSLDPGTCTWNVMDLKDMPPEPGMVFFDVPPEAQPWSGTATRLMDTTVNAAEHFHDPRTIARYLDVDTHYWIFYVDDVTHYSVSFAAYFASGNPPTLVNVSGSLTSDVSRLGQTAELLCRGGPGLSFQRSGSAVSNVVPMSLSYPISRNQAGATGHGLTQGTCAWVDRNGLRAEPGTVRFTTAGNAQIKQAQSGMPVDRTPNAAERFPDANTIPLYMQDGSHFWTFTVAAVKPDSAKAHGAFKRSATAAAVGSLSKASAVRSGPTPVGTKSTVGGPRPGTGTTTGVATVAAAPLRVDNIGLVLDRFTIQFSGRPNASPVVRYSTLKPIQEPSTGRLFFPGGSGMVQGGFQAELAGGSAQGLRASYSAWPRLAPERGKLYYYIITIPASASGKEEQLTGQFTTLAQHARIVITSIELLNTRDKQLSYWVFAASRTSLLYNERPGGGPGQWNLGSHSIGEGVDVSNAPDWLRIQVGMATFVSNLVYYWDWNGRNKDANYARTEVNIGVSPGARSVSVPFSMRSVDGNFLMFEVRGQVNVTRN